MDRTARIVAGEGKDMNQEDIIKLAQKWGDWNGQTVEFNDVGLERFFRLAYDCGAAAEREACAKVAEATVCDIHLPTGVRIYGSKAAAAIRARSKT
jgi:hypothetical protein